MKQHTITLTGGAPDEPLVPVVVPTTASASLRAEPSSPRTNGMEGLHVAQDDQSGVNAFFGTWPGDETDEELQDALRAIG